MDKVILKSNKEESVEEMEFLRQRVAELEEINRRNGRLNDIFSSLNDLVFVLDKEGRFTEFYAPSEELYLPPKKFIGKKHSEVMPFHVTNLLLKAFEKNIQNEVDEYEYALDIAGRKQWYHAKQSPLFKDGQFTGAVAVIRNITRQKHLNEKLKETEDRHCTLIEMGTKIGEAVIMLQDIDGKEGVQTYISDLWSQITGYLKGELLGVSFFDLVIPKDQDLSIKRHRQKMAGKTIPDLFELSIIRKDGKEIPIEITSAATIYKGESTNIVYIRDITERKQTEKELKQYQQHLEELVEERTNEAICQMNEHKRTKEQLQFILDSIPAYVFYKDSQGRYLYINKAIHDTSDMPDETWIGKRLCDIEMNANIDFCEKRHAQDMKVIQNGKAMIKSVNNTGGAWVSTSRIPHRDKKGEIIGLVGLTFDITDLIEAEEKINKLLEKERLLRERLQKETRQKNEFTRALVHELKTPLTPLLGASDLLCNNLQEEPWSTLARQVYQGAVDIDKRIDELFTLTKSEVGKLRLNRTIVEPLTLLRDISNYMMPQAIKTKHKLTISTPKNLPEIYCDPQRVNQVFLNLIDNALKFTPEGTLITLKAKQKDSFLVFQIVDTGHGMPPDKMKYIFMPYIHFNDKVEHLSGLGLGLALCKNLIKLHGGEMTVKNKPGSGCCFTFTIPIALKVDGNRANNVIEY